MIAYHKNKTSFSGVNYAFFPVLMYPSLSNCIVYLHIIWNHSRESGGIKYLSLVQYKCYVCVRQMRGTKEGISAFPVVNLPRIASGRCLILAAAPTAKPF